MLSIVEYLAALGHRRIAHVAGTPNFQHTQRRIRALRDAVPRLGLTDAPSLPTDFSDAEGAATTRKLLSQPVKPTAIIYDSDVMAVAGLGVAMEMGVSVPGDLSIVAFDDSILTQLMHPALTALSRDTFDFGRQAAEVLLEVIADPAKMVNRRTADPVLTVRESTDPPAHQPPVGGIG
jgi:DNA-binding LacI/PurR family transcriptional regulator